MPAAAWPLTVQRYATLPFFRVTESVADLPGYSIGVFFVPTLKSCGRLPLFVTLNVTAPALTDFTDSLMPNSAGEPSVTVTVVAECFAEAGSAKRRAAVTAVIASATIRFLLMKNGAPFRLSLLISPTKVVQISARRILAAACALVFLAVVPSAAAHARIVATQPAQGTVVPEPPARVSFTFDEPVESGGKSTLRGDGIDGSQTLPTKLARGGRLLVATLPAHLA